MPKHFKIDDVLSPGERTDFQRLANDPSSTIDNLSRWLRTRGHKVSRGAVHNWRQRLRSVNADPAAHMRAFVHRQAEILPPDQLADVYAYMGGEAIGV